MSQHMQLALQLAAQWRGRTSPNPLVGAVVVKDGVIVGTGAHEKAGEAHAEVHALNQAGDNARNSTLYVTLEPCSHYGKTPPCTERIIAAGVRRVVAAMTDPNPLVSGRGFARLREAGIEVEVGMGEQAARKLNEIFIKYITTGTPFVILKAALSLDGKIATHTGDSRWITNDAAREHVHQLRGQVDAVLVGKGTLLRDNPRLNVRLSDGEWRDPQKIILTTQLELNPEALCQLEAYRLSTEKPLLIVTARDNTTEQQRRALQELGVDVLSVGTASGGLDLKELLIALGQRGISSLLLEGGSMVYTSFLTAGCVDKLYLYQAPLIIGEDGISWMQGGSKAKIADALRLHEVEYSCYGDNILTTGYLSGQNGLAAVR